MYSSDWWLHTMCETETELEAELASDPDPQHHADLIDILNDRHSRHVIIDSLADVYDHWPNIHNHTNFVSNEDDQTMP